MCLIAVEWVVKIKQRALSLIEVCHEISRVNLRSTQIAEMTLAATSHVVAANKEPLLVLLLLCVGMLVCLHVAFTCVSVSM